MRIICLLVFALISSTVYAETLPDKEAVKELAATVMSKAGEGKNFEAIGLIKPYLLIQEAEFDVMKNQMSKQAAMIEQRFGKVVGSELISVEEAGTSLMRIIYIQKFEKHLMRWKFYFYRPKDNWVLSGFNTDDKIDQMFNKL